MVAAGRGLEQQCGYLAGLSQSKVRTQSGPLTKLDSGPSNSKSSFQTGLSVFGRTVLRHACSPVRMHVRHVRMHERLRTDGAPARMLTTAERCVRVGLAVEVSRVHPHRLL